MIKQVTFGIKRNGYFLCVFLKEKRFKFYKYGGIVTVAGKSYMYVMINVYLSGVDVAKSFTSFVKTMY